MNDIKTQVVLLWLQIKAACLFWCYRYDYGYKVAYKEPKPIAVALVKIVTIICISYVLVYPFIHNFTTTRITWHNLSDIPTEDEVNSCNVRDVEPTSLHWSNPWVAVEQLSILDDYRGSNGFEIDKKSSSMGAGCTITRSTDDTSNYKTDPFFGYERLTNVNVAIYGYSCYLNPANNEWNKRVVVLTVHVDSDGYCFKLQDANLGPPTKFWYFYPTPYINCTQGQHWTFNKSTIDTTVKEPQFSNITNVWNGKTIRCYNTVQLDYISRFSLSAALALMILTLTTCLVRSCPFFHTIPNRSHYLEMGDPDLLDPPSISVQTNDYIIDN